MSDAKAGLRALALLLVLAQAGWAQEPPSDPPATPEAEPEAPASPEGDPPAAEDPPASLPDAMTVMERREKRSLADDERAAIDMKVEAEGVPDRRRQVLRYVLRAEGKERTLIRFIAPPEIRGLAVLTLENPEGEDEQWGYDPKRNKVKRVPPNLETESFAGTGFSYEDFRAEELSAHTYKTLRTEEVLGRPAVIIEARPTPGAKRALKGYSKRLLAIDSERYVILRIEFFDADGELVKVQENTRWAVVGGVYRPYRVKMTEVKLKRTTWVKFRSWAANEGLDEALFTRRALEKEGMR